MTNMDTSIAPFWVTFAIWFIAAIFLANWAEKKKIGFWVAFFISLFLSPFVGAICVAVSPDKEDKQECKHKWKIITVMTTGSRFVCCKCHKEIGTYDPYDTEAIKAFKEIYEAGDFTY